MKTYKICMVIELFKTVPCPAHVCGIWLTTSSYRISRSRGVGMIMVRRVAGRMYTDIQLQTMWHLSGILQKSNDSSSQEKILNRGQILKNRVTNNKDCEWLWLLYIFKRICEPCMGRNALEHCCYREQSLPLACVVGDWYC